MINLSGNTTTQVPIISKTAYSLGQKHLWAGGSGFRGKIPGLPAENTREEYHLTAQGGDLHSQTMLLNGNALKVDENGNIPTMEPVQVEASQPVTLAPYSIVFAHVPFFKAPACR